VSRALPLPPELNPAPISENIVNEPAPEARDFAASIDKVKDVSLLRLMYDFRHYC